MRTLVTATDAPRLNQLVELVHDEWFLTTDLLIVDGAARVDIPLYANADVPARSRPKLRLVVAHVLDVELFDEARIGAVDINEIVFRDENSRAFSVETT